MAEKQTPNGLIVGLIPEEQPEEQKQDEKAPTTRGRKPKTENKD